MDTIHTSVLGGTIHYDRFMSGKWQVYRTKLWGNFRNNLIGRGRNKQEALKDLKRQESMASVEDLEFHEIFYD